MRYYLYVSETKIEMLYQQIAKSEDEQRGASLGFDIKILKGELKESRGIPVNKFSKLTTIVNRLAKEGFVGSLEEQKPYIRGNLKLTWAPFDEPDSDITFWGYASSNLALGLAGSRHHLLGEQKDGLAHSRSLTNVIVSWLRARFADSQTDGKLSAKWSHRENRDYIPFTDADIAIATLLAVEEMVGFRGQFEFVAKVLHRSNWPEGLRRTSITDVLLATPLYVTLEE